MNIDKMIEDVAKGVNPKQVLEGVDKDSQSVLTKLYQAEAKMADFIAVMEEVVSTSVGVAAVDTQSARKVLDEANSVYEVLGTTIDDARKKSRIAGAPPSREDRRAMYNGRPKGRDLDSDK